MVAFFALLCLLVVAVLTALLVPGVWDAIVTFFEGEKARGRELAREFGEDLLDQAHRPERQLESLDARCKPVPDDALKGAEEAGLANFEAYLQELQRTDDPTIWPDDDQAEVAMAAARTAWVAAAQQVECVSPVARAGAAVDGLCREAVRWWIGAQGHGAPPPDVLAGLAQVTLLRARQKDFRHSDRGARAALRLANAALEIDPQHADARLAQAECHVALGRVDAARATLRSFVNDRVRAAPMQRVRSRWLAAQGDWRGAMDAMLLQFDALPDGLGHAERLRVGPLLIEERRLEEAADVFRTLQAWRDDLPQIWEGVSRIELFEKRYVEAEQAARRAIELGGGGTARDLLRQAMVHTASGV